MPLKLGKIFHLSILGLCGVALCAYPPISSVQYKLMGWNSWNTFLCSVNETVIKQTADSFIRLGLDKLQYQYVIIDDCWAAMDRLPNGSLVWDSNRFPSGIPALANYVHSKGLKLGIYSDVGKRTCQDRPGSYGYYEQDAQTFASWGIDYLKLDFCHLADGEFLHPSIYYDQMSVALAKSGRRIVFAICNWGLRDTSDWAPQMANSWRISMDIFPSWIRVMEILDDDQSLSDFSAEYRFNDPDMLEVGVDGHWFNNPEFPKTNLTIRESQSHFVLWSLLRAPLILGNDLRSLSPDSWVFKIIANSAVIALNNDQLAKQGTLLFSNKTGFSLEGLCLGSCSFTQIWGKPLANGGYAVALFNRGDQFDQESKSYKDESIKFLWQYLNIPSNKKFSCTNLLTLEKFQCQGSVESVASPHGLQVFRLTPQ